MQNNYRKTDVDEDGITSINTHQQFIKPNEEPYERLNVESYSKMDFEYFFGNIVPKLVRQPYESWNSFSLRKSNAERIVDIFVFGKLHDEIFELISVPDYYSDYQYAKNAEFGYLYTAGIILASLTIDIGSLAEEIISNNESDQRKGEIIKSKRKNVTYTPNKINEGNIGAAFEYWNIKNELLNNSVNYIKRSCDSDGRISICRWLTSTGKRGRTKEIESQREGCELSWEINHHEDKIYILSPNNIEIGEIGWNNECDDDSEYWEVYKPLIFNGSILIESVTLNKIIPHSTPEGRPRKALAQVVLNMKISNLSINRDPLDVNREDLQSMRKLSAIDYNRKCDIIEGIIPEYPANLEELFHDEEFEHGEEFATFDLIWSKGFLSGYVFTSKELEEIWNIYRNIENYFNYHRFHIDDENGESQKQESKTLFCKGKYFNYAFEQETEFTIWDGRLREKTIRLLKLYRK